LLEAFCKISSREGLSSFFYGDTQNTLEVARDKLSQTFPGLKIVGIYSPPFRELTPDEDAQIVDMINQANPDVLWVALGLPKQERWIVAHLGLLKVPVIVAIGAAIKFHSGKVKPAPRWASRAGFEWLWRFFHEPRRTWRRAFVYGPQFAALCLWDLARSKRRGQGKDRTLAVK
jgi:N-acetylglucosaminyldiphosphoundecaprenol N-acetyl-beta-D-mannosaminyltransferase